MDSSTPPDHLPPDALIHWAGQALFENGWLGTEPPTAEEQSFLGREADWLRRDKVSRATLAGTCSGPPQPAPAPLAPEIAVKAAAIRMRVERGRREAERSGQLQDVVTALRVALCTGAIGSVLKLPTGQLVDVPADIWRDVDAWHVFMRGTLTIGACTGRVLFVRAGAETWRAGLARPPEPETPEEAATAWLRAEVENGEKRHSADDYRSELVRQFHIPMVVAERIWAAVAPKAWKDGGRPRRP